MAAPARNALAPLLLFRTPSMINGLTNAGALPVLERLVQFAGARHRLIVSNIANLDTPGYRPVDVSVKGFQSALGEAIDERRAHPRPGAELDRIELAPEPVGENILFHDGNDRDLERTMQHLVENFMTFRFASEMLRSRFDAINTAIRERI